jgi:hypothetical protein
LANQLDGKKPELPGGVKITTQGDFWLRFRIESPQKNNPVLIKNLISAKLNIISFQEVQRSLESAYLEAMRTISNGEQNAR